MSEKSWSLIVAELRGLRNEIVAMVDDPDADFLDIVDCLDCAADSLEERYWRSAD